MNKTLLRLFALSIFISVISATTAAAQDFQKSYSLKAGDRIHVSSTSGDIIVTGYDGEAVVVSGYKEGRDSDMVTIEDLSTANAIELRTRYPKDCNCNASVRFEVKVPRSINFTFDSFSTASGDIQVSSVRGELRAKTASGDVRVTDVAGRINASSASGDVEVKNASGSVNARSASGDIEVEINSLEGTDNMTFSSASGDVRVRMPGNLDAEVEMVTHSGSLDTDFPIQIEEKRYGPGRSARGRVGSGARTLRITAASGNVSLKRL